jgi:hypothetical protein
MPNLLDTASQWLSDQQDEHTSSDVVYSRGSLSSNLVAGRGRTTFDATDSSGMVINVQSHDFLVSADLIVLDGVESLPEVGDKITAGSLMYEVMRFGTEQHYRQCDPFGHKLRIHTKFVGQVAN